MAASKGNKNAVGNRGGKSLQDRELAAEVRKLALYEMKLILEQPGLNEMKKQLVLKLANSVLPRLNEHTGRDGQELPQPLMVISNVIPNNNSDQQNSSDELKDTGSTGGNVSEQDNQHPNLLDSLSSK